MSLSRQLLVLVGVSVLFGLGARVVQKQTVPFWGFPKPIEMIQPRQAMADPATSTDSAFVPADQPYLIDYATASVLYGKRTKNNIHFVDARDVKLYAEGHIPGAVNIPFERVEENQAKLDSIPKTDLVLCYCDGGDCHLSKDLAAKMIENGWKRLAVYEGGWAEWSKESDFVAKGEDKPEVSETTK
jgi:rhodanese-related sulfurtransferase